MTDANRDILADAQLCLDRAIAAYAFGATSYSNEAMHHCMRMQKKIAELQRVQVGDHVRRPDMATDSDDEFSSATFTIEFITHDGYVLARWDQRPEVMPFVWESSLCEVVPTSLNRAERAA